MIKQKTARQALYDWHGGQSSSFYAAASSGLVADWDALKRELAYCYGHATTAKDKAQLARLLDWIIFQRDKGGNSLPWAKATA